MIGYIIGMNLMDILNKVNYWQSEKNPGNPVIVFEITSYKGLYKADQQLVRLKVTPKNFNLHHLWVDIKHNYTSL